MKILKLLLIFLLFTVPCFSQTSGGAGNSNDWTLPGGVTVGAYARSVTIPSGQATVGATAPTATTVGTFRALGFDANNELAYMNVEVPEDWDGISDMTLKIYYFTTNGDPVQDGETIKIDVDYRSIAEGEAIDNGNAVSITNTYTATGAQTDKEMFEQEITIDFDHGDQPLTAGDIIGFLFNRDVDTDTYTGAVIVVRWEVDYTSIGLPVH